MGLCKEFNEFTLVLFVRITHNRPEVLFGRKKEKFGAGKWMAPGGKINSGESRLRGAAREAKEETGVEVDPTKLRHGAVIDCINTLEDGSYIICRIWIYFLEEWEGEPHETDSKELTNLTWHSQNPLPPDDQMMAGDPEFLPMIFEGRRIYAIVPYAPNQATLNGPVTISDLPWYLKDRP